jgi:molybdopterin synthase sulfur carrier subunit
MVKILFFAGLREAVGTPFEELSLPAGVATVGGLRDHIAGRGEPWLALTRTRNLRAAVNQAIAGVDAPVADGDEVAFFPPVTGG